MFHLFQLLNNRMDPLIYVETVRFIPYHRHICIIPITTHSGHMKLSWLSHREEEGWRLREETSGRDHVSNHKSRCLVRRRDNFRLWLWRQGWVFYTKMSGQFTAVWRQNQKFLARHRKNFPDTFMAIKPGIFNGTSWWLAALSVVTKPDILIRCWNKTRPCLWRQNRLVFTGRLDNFQPRFRVIEQGVLGETLKRFPPVFVAATPGI